MCGGGGLVSCSGDRVFDRLFERFAVWSSAITFGRATMRVLTERMCDAYGLLSWLLLREAVRCLDELRSGESFLRDCDPIELRILV